MSKGQKPETHELDANAILIAEFEYAAQTAAQAIEDRVNVVHYYYAAIGALVAVVALLDVANSWHLALFGALTLGLFALGLMSLLNLAKLRLAWRDSVQAMCRIKEYYFARHADVGLSAAFRWQSATIPPAAKPWSMAFLMALTTSLVSSVSLGGTVFLWGLAAGRWLAWPGALSAALGFGLQVGLWFWICRD